MVWKGVNVAFRVVLVGISALSESEWLIHFLSTHGTVKASNTASNSKDWGWEQVQLR